MQEAANKRIKPSAVLYSGVNVPLKISEWFLVQISISGGRGTSACSLGVTSFKLQVISNAAFPIAHQISENTLFLCSF